MLGLQPATSEACVLVVFGASGDLTRRKVAPALYNLARGGALPEPTVVLGFGRTEFSDEQFRAHLKGNVARFSQHELIAEVWESLAARIFYQHGDYANAAAFEQLRQRLEYLDEQFGLGGSRTFYFAIAPDLTPAILDNLASCGLIQQRHRAEEKDKGYIRVVLEKPFGRDLESARSLNKSLEEKLDESQVFRMDHYLGKETVQNIIVLRFANSIFEPVWNNRHVKHIHVTVAETVGVAGRTGYFERTGALRDVMQNHVLQLLSLVTMEPPYSLDADSIRDEKAKVLRCLRPVSGEDLRCAVVRGQYGAGQIDGAPVPAYRDEDGVDPESSTETLVALRTYIDNWRWSGVPIYLATGKRMAAHLTEIAVEFKEIPHVLFRALEGLDLQTNLLKIRVQPKEGVSVRICTKAPGLAMEMRPVEMDFPYESVFSSASPEAYERLLLDVMDGNATLFARRDEIELAWLFVEPILRDWEHGPAPAFPNYPAGTWGPIRGTDFFREDTCYSRAPARVEPRPERTP